MWDWGLFFSEQEILRVTGNEQKIFQETEWIIVEAKSSAGPERRETHAKAAMSQERGCEWVYPRTRTAPHRKQPESGYQWADSIVRAAGRSF